MEKNEIITKIQALRKELKEKKREQLKGTIKDTSVFKKLKREIASLLTKLNTQENGV